jgi:hypothetical protein
MDMCWNDQGTTVVVKKIQIFTPKIRAHVKKQFSSLQFQQLDLQMAQN